MYGEPVEIADAFIRPEHMLSKREEVWKVFMQCIHEMTEFKALEIYNAVGTDDYSGVRLLKKLRETI